jgi:hypothetical protein
VFDALIMVSHLLRMYANELNKGKQIVRSYLELGLIVHGHNTISHLLHPVLLKFKTLADFEQATFVLVI